jgi:hypothetical protein
MPVTTTVTVFGPSAPQVKVSDSEFRISLQLPLLAAAHKRREPPIHTTLFFQKPVMHPNPTESNLGALWPSEAGRSMAAVFPENYFVVPRMNSSSSNGLPIRTSWSPARNEWPMERGIRGQVKRISLYVSFVILRVLSGEWVSLQVVGIEPLLRSD